MTSPLERTKAVLETRNLLLRLATADYESTLVEARLNALRLLRHFPLDIDIDMSAALVPSIWAPSSTFRREDLRRK
ncbi:BPSL0761 family protein [Paraburkholderia caribensis]|uniref:BPSL0761 family protein n=1 Tax=Paraburkholderia caribensis TaxID=75105 RepID=UPI0025B665E5|nr:BPSL0761 family protein [Paraburkholderia caribensis]